MRQYGFGGLCVSGRSLHNVEPQNSPAMGIKQGTLQLAAQNVLFHNTMPGALLVPSSHTVSKPLHQQLHPPHKHVQMNTWVSDQKACKQRGAMRYPQAQMPVRVPSRTRKTEHKRIQLHEQPHVRLHPQAHAHTRSQSAVSHAELRKLRCAASERPQLHEAEIHLHDSSRSESAPGSVSPSQLSHQQNVSSTDTYLAQEQRLCWRPESPPSLQRRALQQQQQCNKDKGEEEEKEGNGEDLQPKVQTNDTNEAHIDVNGDKVGDVKASGDDERKNGKEKETDEKQQLGKPELACTATEQQQDVQAGGASPQRRRQKRRRQPRVRPTAPCSTSHEGSEGSSPSGSPVRVRRRGAGQPAPLFRSSASSSCDASTDDAALAASVSRAVQRVQKHRQLLSTALEAEARDRQNSRRGRAHINTDAGVAQAEERVRARRRQQQQEQQQTRQKNARKANDSAFDAEQQRLKAEKRVTDRRNKMSQQQHAAEERAKHDRNRVAIARDARTKAKEVRRAHIYALNDLYRRAREQRLLQAANEVS